MSLIGRAPAAHRPVSHARLAGWAAAALGLVGLIGLVVNNAIESYHDRIALRGLDGKPSPVRLIVSGEALVIPANMIRFRSERRGGEVDSVDLVLHWPSLEGFTDERAADFRTAAPDGPLIYATLSRRESNLDSIARLDTIYRRFFDGPAIEGPEGLTGRRLSAESGYAGEVVYYGPRGAPPFVARCIAADTPEIPATCLRDVNIGQGLSLLYRFNHARLGEWRAMDDRLRRLVNHFFFRQ